MNGDVLERAIAALKAHEAWHLNQGDMTIDGVDIDLAEAYSDGSLCAQTTEAIQDLEIELVMLSPDGLAPIPIDYTNYRGVRSIYYIRPIRLVHGANEWHPNAHVLIQAEVAGKGLRTFDPAHIHRWGAYSFDALTMAQRQNVDLQEYNTLVRERALAAERKVGELRTILDDLLDNIHPVHPAVVQAREALRLVRDWEEERREGYLRGQIARARGEKTGES